MSNKVCVLTDGVNASKLESSLDYKQYGIYHGTQAQCESWVVLNYKQYPNLNFFEIDESSKSVKRLKLNFY